MPTTVKDIAIPLEAWAPLASGFDYDNVGLQIGRRDGEVRNVLVALDLTSKVIDEAEKLGAELIITHHPLFFRPQKRLTGDDLIGGLALRMAERGIAYYAIHTNLDVALGGVSFALAERLGLQDIRFLKPEEGSLVKFLVFVPESHAEAVRTAAAEFGAGRIGNYDACSFEISGTGRFRPAAGASPFIGKAEGEIESVEEIRLEMEVMRWDVGGVLEAIRAVHPYEEVAYDVFPMEKPASLIGSGAIGSLRESTSLNQFLVSASSTLNAASIRYSGDDNRPIKTVAVCGGSGSSLVGRAIREGADAFLTADVTYHAFFEALDSEDRHQIAIVDVGHYESEAHTEQLIVDYLKPRFEDVVFHRTKVRTSQMRTFVRP